MAVKQEKDEERVLYIDGDRWTAEEIWADLTFKERRELRSCVRESLGDETAEVFNAVDDADLIPPMVWLLRRRTDEKYTLDEALELKPKDLEAPEENVPEIVAGPPSPAAVERPSEDKTQELQSVTNGTPDSSASSDSDRGTLSTSGNRS